MENLGITLDNNGLLALVVMDGLIVLGLRESWKAWSFVRASVQTGGEVVAYQTREEAVRIDDRESLRDVYAQVISYTDSQGVTRTFNGPTTRSRKRQTIGPSIPVRYHPQQAVPEREDSIKALYGRPIVLLIILIVVFVIMLSAS